MISPALAAAELHRWAAASSTSELYVCHDGEMMTVATVQFMSNALWREVTYSVLIPDPEVAGSGPYPVLLQLHGGNQNYSSWLHYSTLRAQVRDLPLIVVLPDGAQSRWANGGTPFTAYEDFLVQELPRHIRQMFPASSGKWAIGGNSMGGFGAVRIGLKYPQLFYSIWSHSGGFPSADTLAEHWFWAGNPDDLDCYAVVDKLEVSQMPLLSFDCGVDDHLLADNRRFHDFLEEQRVPHTYHEHTGGHNWEYWNEHLSDALRQHIEAMPSAS
jgi:S-formylglutathione hydrolase FrmB